MNREMRLFITKQNCNRGGVVSGAIPLHEAKLMDASDNEMLSGVLELDYGLTTHVNDCDWWDGTREELIDQFQCELDFLRAKGVHNSNELFRQRRALNALEWLHE